MTTEQVILLVITGIILLGNFILLLVKLLPLFKSRELWKVVMKLSLYAIANLSGQEQYDYIFKGLIDYAKSNGITIDEREVKDLVNTTLEFIKDLKGENYNG